LKRFAFFSFSFKYARASANPMSEVKHFFIKNGECCSLIFWVVA
jgi:hypothetical protein